MDFFNSLSQVYKNKDNFKKWEENQKDEQAKREELYQRRKYSDAEIAEAKALGENIIDVVDIMDNHSESVAENVETATQPIVATAPIASILGSGFLIGKYVHRPNAKKINEILDSLEKNEEAKELCRKINDFNIKNANNRYFGVSQLTYKKSIQKIKDPDLRTEAMKYFNKFQKETSKYRKAQKYGWIGAIGLTIASFIGANIYAAKLQVDSSKIARYQARKSLEDPKAFVTYTPEQIAKAKEEIAKHPELLKKEKKSKLKQGMFKSIYNILKDRKAYKQARKNDTDESKIVTRELTPEEVQKSKQDQEVIQRTVRLINNEAEKYSQNMEVASEVIINGTPFLGALVGGAVGFVLNKLGIINKYVDNQVSKIGSEKTKELYKDLKAGKESGASVLYKWQKFNKSFMENVNNTEEITKDGFKKGAKKVKAGDFLVQAKGWFTSALAHPKGRSWLIAGIGSAITSVVGMMIGLKLTKSASRAGRYTAKRELEKDPRNFIGYTEDDYNEVKDVKTNKKGVSKFKEIVMFLPNVFKQYFEYERYRKNEYRQKQVLNDELQKQEVSEEQLKKAKNLQRKIFNTFEKVDDNSQTYSESMEAAIDIAQPFVVYGGILTAFSPLIWAGIQVKRGKLSGAKLLNKVTTFFSKSSDKLKSKWFKKYLNNVAKNVSTRVQGTNVDHKPVGAILKNVDLQNDSIYNILSKCLDNIKASTGDFRKMTNREQELALWNARDSIVNVLKNKDKDLARRVGRIFDIFAWNKTPIVRADALDILVNPKSIKTMSKERYNDAVALLKEIVTLEIGGIRLQNFYDGISGLFQGEKINTLKSNLMELKSNPQLKTIIKSEDIDKAINSIEQLQDSVYIRDSIGELFSHENVTGAIDAISNLKEKLKEIPEALKSIPELQDISGTTKGLELPITAKTFEPLKILGVHVPEEDTKITAEIIQNILKETQAKVKGLTIKQVTELCFKDIHNPKSILQKLKSKAELMTDDEFAQMAEDFKFSSMDKKTLLEIIPKVEKMLDNIPKEEVNAIWNKIITEFNQHPDEFIKLVKSGKVGQIFMTPGLKKALKIAGISFTTFTLVMTYAIESWLADIKLKAGRLGVMKAMEGLEDNRYYADIEPTQQQSLQPQENNSSNLMAKFKK